uniref:Corticotropin-releasing factor-binding protein n=1 Tax=Monodelphis domestica TaxID=13616 RepID=A0A5F8GDA1_MONDO
MLFGAWVREEQKQWVGNERKQECSLAWSSELCAGKSGNSGEVLGKRAGCRWGPEKRVSSPDLYCYHPTFFTFRLLSGCIDMLSIEGQFTFTAEQPQLQCAAFFIGEPEEVISIQYDLVSVDCQGGDFLKVFDGWILKGEKFPSSQDHPLPMSDRYIDFCESENIRTFSSSQNVAMIFFRIHEPGNGFTITVKKNPNLFPCNVISQTPNGRFTMVIPHQHRNCSFSIIYPVVIKISDLILGHLNGLQLKVSCLLLPKSILTVLSIIVPVG